MKKALWEEYRALYLHIPFCRQKCLYCDFASYAGFGRERMEAYTAAVCREIAVRSAQARQMADGATIYFGGGTPSVLPISCLEQLVQALRTAGFWRAPAEATIEVNPGTVAASELRALRQLGFDRISFGVQSLQDGELRAVGRLHNARQALEAVESARAAGFRRISCDLMYGLPGQTLQSLRDTLLRLTAAGPEHLSVYGLIVEEGTPLERLLERGKLRLPDEDAAADMYDEVQRLLAEQGFERYEISNYAKNGQHSLHNIVYWQYRPYLGFGAAACGFDGSTRRTAAADVEEYIEGAGSLSAADWRCSSLYAVEELSREERLAEFMFMGLRRSAGADLREAQERFGIDVRERYAGKLEPFIRQGLAAYSADGVRLRLTEQGMAVGNRVFELFVGEL